MAEASESISVPLAFHQRSIESGDSLIQRLSLELESERFKNMELTETLNKEKQKTSELESRISLMIKPGVPRISSWDSIASTAAEEPTVGIYPTHIRREKIQKYKLKLKKYKEKVHVSRKFKGRSNIAKSKPRVNGKFIKYLQES